MDGLCQRKLLGYISCFSGSVILLCNLRGCFRIVSAIEVLSLANFSSRYMYVK